MNFKADFNFDCPVAGTWEEEVKVWFSKEAAPGKRTWKWRAASSGKRREEGKREYADTPKWERSKTVRRGSRAPFRWPFPAQVSFSRASHWPRLLWRWEGDAARSSSGSRAARHFR